VNIGNVVTPPANDTLVGTTKGAMDLIPDDSLNLMEKMLVLWLYSFALEIRSSHKPHYLGFGGRDLSRGSTHFEKLFLPLRCRGLGDDDMASCNVSSTRKIST
jgi:hypothetical protein